MVLRQAVLFLISDWQYRKKKIGKDALLCPYKKNMEGGREREAFGRNFI
jgi:hypothetical protein